MLDNAIDVSRFPLPQQQRRGAAKRRIGLGVTGLADALIFCGLRYGSAAAVAVIEDWLGAIEREAYRASAALAAEKGPFPLFDRERYLAGETDRRPAARYARRIAAHGIRNALLTSIAPTGTISLFADNVSSGIEPVFSLRYTRNVLMPDGTRREEEVADYAYRLFRRLRGETAPLPDYFVDAQTLTPEDHLAMQAAAQQHIDSSISKTINVPAEIPFERFKDVYLASLCAGLQGLHHLSAQRGDRRGAGGAARDAAATERATRRSSRNCRCRRRRRRLAKAGGHLRGRRRRLYDPAADRPEALPGHTYKIKWPDSDHAFYITINDIEQDGRRRPFEIFINSKNMEHYAWTLALTRMICAVFRRGGDVSFVVEELKAVFDPRGGAWMGGRYVPSLLAAIGDVIERHMIEIGFLPARGGRTAPAAARSSTCRRAAPGVRSLGKPAAAPGAMPQMRRGGADPHRRLRPVHQLRLFEMRVTRAIAPCLNHDAGRLFHSIASSAAPI